METYTSTLGSEVVIDLGAVEGKAVEQTLSSQAPLVASPVLDDPSYQLDQPGGPNSQRAIDEAAKVGLDVVFPKPNELQIDIDSVEQFGKFEELYSIFRKFQPIIGLSVVDRKNQFSRSGWPKYHITLTLDKDITDDFRITLQSLLGSDPIREMLGFIQVLKGDPHPILFLEKKEEVKQ